MKYIYNNKAQLVYSVFDVVTNEDIKKVYPSHYISNHKYDYAKIEINEVLPMSNAEIEAEKYRRFTNGEYELQKDEIIDRNRVKKIKLKEYEYISKGKVHFDYEKKRQDLINRTYVYQSKEELKDIVYAEIFTIPVSNNNYMRELYGTMSLYSIIGIPKRLDIKVLDTERNEKYIEITDTQYKAILAQINQNKTKAVKKFLRIRNYILQMEETEISEFELTENFEI